MDVKELLLSCRRGDLQKVQYLVEHKEVDLNVRDKWDSTPLYYACLCGHIELVKYMLENGAVCEANTFDGERCLYGALNNQIRNLLKSYKMVSSKTLRRDLYEEFLRRLQESGMYEDVTFHVHGERFPAHRCILSARCHHFAELFRTRWKGRKDIYLKHQLLYPWAFKSLLQYIYTGHLDTHIENIDDCKRLAKQCKMYRLMEEIDEKYTKLKYFECTKLGVEITKLRIESPQEAKDLQFDLGKLGDLALPHSLSKFIQGELPFEAEDAPLYADIIFNVEGHQFLCHKVFFCGRSDYFKALLIDHFGETDVTPDNHPVVTLRDVTADIFTRVMYYIYQDSCELTEDTVYDVLCCADLYLLPGLKRQCARVLCQYIMVDNVVQILLTSRLFVLPRLEDQCAEFIAHHLEEVLRKKDFQDLVISDAGEIQSRQETDSIGIIDDIRFHITSFVQTFSEMQEADEKLKLIDELLEELDLEG